MTALLKGYMPDLAQKLYKTDGAILDYPPQGAIYTLKELQEAVGGYIEMLRLEDGYLMFINEEGAILDLPRNVMASVVCRAVAMYPYIGGDDLRGNVLICHESLVE